MARAPKAAEQPPEPLQPPDTPQESRTDPDYGKTNYFLPIDEGRPAASYYELKANLSVPIARELISEKPSGRGRDAVMIAYVNITDLKDLLDERVGVWTADIVHVIATTAELLVSVRLNIHAIDGVFSQDGSGTEWLAHKGYGDTFSNAYAQAFRRACEGHGLGRELWRKTEVAENQVTPDYSGADDRPAETNNSGYDATARSLGDAATEKQLGLIRTKERYLKKDVQQICKQEFNCSIEELSKRAASDLIDILSNMQPSQDHEARPVQSNAPSAASSTRGRANEVAEEFMNNQHQADSGPPATAKQKEYIKNICLDKNKNEELFALELFKTDFDSMTKAQASQMIAHLVPKSI